MTNDVSPTVTLANLKHTVESEKPAVWKEFGAYLQKLDRRLDPNLSPELALNVALLYLAQATPFQVCKLCGRPIGQELLASHYDKCVEMKKSLPSEKRKRPRLEVEALSVDSLRGTLPVGTPAARPKKKYKKLQMQREKEAAAAAAAQAPDREKKKKVPKPKPVAKAKGPINVEKQCGVPLPLGGFCARSLTCKTHLMGAKRAVPGRSAPYDVLLQQYQKRNQAKLVANNAMAAARRENALDLATPSMAVVLDPDEETHLVLEGLSKNNPLPLERRVLVAARLRHMFLYMREAYANALIMKPSADSLAALGDLTLANQAILGSIGGLQGRCALVNVDLLPDQSTQAYAAVPGELYVVRAPLKAIQITAQYNVQQQQLFQQQVLKLQQQMMARRA